MKKEAALAYATQGIPIFPVQGKIPFAGTRGFYEATTDLHKIEYWWCRWPQANIAIPTGRSSKWIVLDIDEIHDGLNSFRQLQMMLAHQEQPLTNGPIRQTKMARTGRGYHLIFTFPDQWGTLPRNRVQIAGLPGLDLRGEGGYIVAPPSQHPNGAHYRWLIEMDPAPFPTGLIDLLRWQKKTSILSPEPQAAKRRSYPERIQWQNPEYWLERALNQAQKGTRHRGALWLACRLIEHAHLTPTQAVIYLHRYVDGVPGGHEDYSLQDALNCLQWAAQHL